MKSISSLFAIIITLLTYQYNSLAQGCSDAGLCSINLNDEDTTSKVNYYIDLFNAVGVGDESVFINSTGVEFGIKYSDFGFLAKLPYTITNGNLGQTNGFGDLTLLISSIIYSKDDLVLSLAGGVKIATNEADLRNQDNLPMPMAFQTSNGTNDIIALFSANYSNWVLSTGVQIPLDRNKNSFINKSTLVDPIPGVFDYYYLNWSKYESSRNFKRGSDAMLKIEKYFEVNEGLKLMVGVLPVHRLSESVYEDFGGEDITIKNTNGLTLNIISSANYEIAENLSLGLNLGFPIVTRKVRADGLTRAIVANFDFKIKL